MPDEIDASVHSVKPLLRHAVVYGVSTQAGGQKLAARYDAVLVRSDARNGRIAGQSTRQTADTSPCGSRDCRFPH
jgi:hypothetical protein